MTTTPRLAGDAWNDTKADYPRDHPVHALFEEQAARAPGRAALAFEGERITYGDLNARANRLARLLRERGVAPGALVGVSLPRGPRMVEAVLAILKAGAAYVPLDPAYPAERLAFMVDDAEAAAVVTESRLLDRLGSARGRAICLDLDRGALDAQPADDLRLHVPADALAYVIYTSGSTGTPKGTEIAHRALVNFLWAMRAQVGIGPEDRVLALTSLSFDIAGLELHLPLVTGASIRLVPQEATAEPRALAERLSDATLAQATPATWRMLVESGWAGGPALRALCGGEALSADLARALRARVARLWNVYGPTETTVWSAIHEVVTDEACVPIGRPLANTRLHVVDAHGAEAQEGELWIGGDGLARGYLRRPDLTAERFVTWNGERVYRTGDLVRRRADGTLDFLGRLDHQVKVRGHRVELGEVEAALRARPGVRDAVATAREGALVAYVLLAPGAPRPGAAEWRAALARTLPSFMIPSAFVALDAFPLTPNGKVDRHALPEPDARAGLDATFVAPRTPEETALAAIWAEVLGLPEVGVEDDFFALGGHSLLATKVVARARERLGVEIPLARVFETPTVAALARDARERGVPTVTALRKPPRADPIPLSFPQVGAKFMQELAPTAGAYNTNFLILFRGRLDHGVLERALSEIVRRHELLRTTFPDVGGRPAQVVHEPFHVEVPYADLRGREGELDARIRDEMRRPFDLARLPLARWRLFQRGDDDFVLLHMEHHLLHDGWSFNNFYREVLELYKAFAEDRPSPLPDLDWQFADFATWQRAWMEGPEAKAQMAYWKERLAGSTPLLDIPADRPRPPVKTYHGASLRVEIPPALADELRELSRASGATLFMTMSAAFTTLLHRYTGAQDFNVGTSVANRRWRETEPLTGMIVNTLVLRMDASGDPTFAELLRRVRRETLGAYGNQDVPFERVVEELRPQRSLSHNPLFQAFFNFHDAPLPDVEVPGLRTDLVEVVSNGSSKFDVNVIVIPRREQRSGSARASGPGGMTVIWEYSTDLFDASTIERMSEHYLRVLRAVARDPSLRLRDVELLPEAERETLLGWGRVRIPYPRDATLHGLFEQRAAMHPDRIALTGRGETLTYAQLDARANRLARHLRGLGIDDGARVGILLERSVDAVVATLAILKAGGAFVPLDPEHPRERLQHMLRDADARVVVTRSGACTDAPEGARVVLLDEDAARIGAQPATPPESASGAESLAYVMYTSGSTGRPKGVEVVHRGVVRLVKEATYVDVREDDVFLQLSAITFDPSQFETWGALLHGARLAIGPPPRASPRDIGAAVRDEGATIVWLTAPLFHLMVDERLEDLRGVRFLLAGGDVLSPPHVERAARALPGCQIVNAYGPTECTTFATCHAVGSSRRPAASVPIGRPIGNTDAHVLDPHGQLVPIGVPGELHLGGDGLARGYHARPDLTAERFVTWNGERVYRTGDLVRWLPDGNLEFLGRMDNQVKIRGFRIELGEVEAVLAEHVGVKEAVALARQDAPGEKRLVAYLVLHAGREPPRARELRAFLRERLPDHMIPSAFVALDAFPLTPNGKVDRKALPAPDGARDDARQDHVAPRTSVETRLAAIWGEVLGVPRVGAHDHFFELGGHSLLATQVASRVRDEFGVELPLRAFFVSPTLEALAAAVDEGRATLAAAPRATPP